MNKHRPPHTWRVIESAWSWNGHINLIDGEALLLATLMHTHGNSRDSEDGAVLRRLMKDINL